MESLTKQKMMLAKSKTSQQKPRKPKASAIPCSFRLEKAFNLKTVIGLDEVGRGPLAGPVVAAAVCFDPEDWDSQDEEMLLIQDSKKIRESLRESLSQYIQSKAKWFHIEELSAEEVDTRNILQASLEAFRRLYVNCTEVLGKPELVLVDGNNKVPRIDCKQQSVIGGDRVSKSIAAASIIAKVYRDQLMKAYSKQFPQYGFEQHKGYGTKKHWEALLAHGPCEIHRQSFLGRLKKKEKGDKAEVQAADYLCSKGYEVHAKNWKSNIGEIDLIVKKNDELRFVEVRARKDIDVSRAFPKSKQQQFQRAVKSYVLKNGLGGLKIHYDFIFVTDAGLETYPDVFGF